VDEQGTMTNEDKPAGVPMAKQAGETEVRWNWVERTVWTERMLKALETGVKGGVWFSLMDKVYSRGNLRVAFAKVKSNAGAAGVDHVTVEQYEKNLEEELERLHKQLREGRYRPQRIRRHYIDKPGSGEKRPLGIPTIRDRVVQTALRNVIEPIFEWEFAANSHGFRPGRGCKDALRQVKQRLESGHYWVVDADIRSYFDCIDHGKLMELIRERIADGRVLDLIESFLEQEVMEQLRHWKPERGCPQGAVISPLLANIYLNALDHEMAHAGLEMIRYADDLVVLCSSTIQAQQALEQVQDWMRTRDLQLHPTKTCVVDMHHESFDFLGYHFQAHKAGLPRISKWPRAKSLRKLRSSLKPLTKRANGRSLEHIIVLINPKLTGWFEYYKHSTRPTFVGLDGWVRGRLRAMLRKRKGLKGRGRGADHQRWPNAYFHDRGLFSLLAAFESSNRSSSR